jgi:hypothetical protein
MASRVYEVASIEDIGTEWQLTGVVVSDTQFLDTAGGFYMRLSAVTADILQQMLEDGHTVVIPKSTDLSGPELQPGDLQITESTEGIERVRNSAISSARTRMYQRFTTLNVVVLFNYMEGNNVLQDAGYNITDANREENYLAILNTGNTALIQQLEEYLEAKDQLSAKRFLWEQYKIFKTAVLASETEEEVETLRTQFFSIGS